MKTLLLAVCFISPILGQGDLALGRKIFESQCALCHGQDGRGGRGPSLAKTRFKRAAGEAGLREVIVQGVPGTEMPGSWQINEREVAAVAAYVLSLGRIAVETLPGDPARGAALYQSKGCPSCHIIAGQGSGFGPELTEIGDKRSAAHLRESLTQPAAAVPEGFLVIEAVTASGEKIRGLRLNEDSFTIQLKDAQQRFHSLRKAQLKDLRKLPKESPMPPYALPPGELDDLVSYLAGLRGKS